MNKKDITKEIHIGLFELDKIDCISVSCVYMDDYPKFCEAFIDEAYYKGVKMDEVSLCYLNQNYPEFICEEALKSIYR